MPSSPLSPANDRYSGQPLPAGVFGSVQPYTISVTPNFVMPEFGTVLLGSDKETPDMSEHPTKDEMKAEIARSAAEVRTDVVRIEGQINTALATIVTKLDAISEEVKSSRSENKENRLFIIGTGIAVVGVLVGIMTYGDAIYSRGMQVRDVMKSVVEEMRPATPLPQPPSKEAK